MKQAQYARKGKIIIQLKDGAQKHYKHVNEAKRASRKLQQDADKGMLGRGTLRVIPT